MYVYTKQVHNESLTALLLVVVDVTCCLYMTARDKETRDV